MSCKTIWILAILFHRQPRPALALLITQVQRHHSHPHLPTLGLPPSLRHLLAIIITVHTLRLFRYHLLLGLAARSAATVLEYHARPSLNSTRDRYLPRPTMRKEKSSCKRRELLPLSGLGYRESIGQRRSLESRWIVRYANKMGELVHAADVPGLQTDKYTYLSPAEFAHLQSDICRICCSSCRSIGESSRNNTTCAPFSADIRNQRRRGRPLSSGGIWPLRGPHLQGQICRDR